MKGHARNGMTFLRFCTFRYFCSARLTTQMSPSPYGFAVAFPASCHARKPPVRFTTVLYPCSVSFFAAAADLRPLRQNTATGFVLSSFAVAFSMKSLSFTSISTASGIVPSAYSSAVRTSTSCTPSSLCFSRKASNAVTSRSV